MGNMNGGMLYIVATPIGNLGDITFRALETLKTVDIILCEDTRVTGKLLSHYKINTPTISYHQHSDSEKVDRIVSLLGEGKNLALVTDAGTPGISDPGNRLIEDLRLKIEDLRIIAIPGASATTAALSISGLPTDKFIFMGFPPHKKGRKKFFGEIKDAKYTIVFYESCHRITKCLNELGEILEKDRQVCIGRELTKKFESVYRGTIPEILEQKIPEKGEFVIVISHCYK